MSLRIGDVDIENPFVLAPMAGVNCAAFRRMCREEGAALIYTQMYHCDFLLHKLETEGRSAVFDFINIQMEERPVSVQLVGNSPENMAKAAGLVEEVADIIDINFGCCDTNIIKAECGGYFTKNIDLMVRVAESVVAAVEKPVTAKIRIGWDSQSINGVEAALRLQDCGISGLAVHGRTVKQKYGGKANWQIIKQIKQKLEIPVIGNGDVNNAGRAMEMMDVTKCDFVMVGRRTKGDPGFFGRCLRKYNGSGDFYGSDSLNGTSNKDGSFVEVKDAKELYPRFLDYYGRLDNDKSFTEIKAHSMWFAKRACLGPKKRERIAFARTKGELEEIFFSE